MKTYIQAQGFQVWQSIVDGYTTLAIPPTNDKEMKLGENNSKSKNALLNSFSDTVFTKVAHCKSATEMWDNFEIFMKEIQKSKKQRFKLTEVTSNN
jgi:hypothetical protein